MIDCYVADFETTTDPKDCRVWAWGIYNIEKDLFEYGNTREGFFDRLSVLPDKSNVYFHNLKFDGEFLFYHLFEHGYKHVETKSLNDGEFTTLITNFGVFYSIVIKLNDRKITIYDSAKIIPLPLAEIPRAFRLRQLKGDIDYHSYRPVGHELTDKEIEYLKNDVEIVGKALSFFFEQDLTKMTQASNAFYDFKQIIGGKVFKKRFPILNVDGELRASYKGGYTYVNEKYKGKVVHDGIVFDVNSLYPYVMYEKKLPYGEPKHFKGEYQPIKFYDLYIQSFRCDFELKPNHLPMIQIKNNVSFQSTEYVKDNDGEEVILTLTSVDLQLFKEHYNIYNMEYLEGWAFKSTDIIFKEYIDKWSKIKIESHKNGNEGMRTIAKLMLNALYGKFGSNPKTKSKIPYFQDGLVKYRNGEESEKDPIYVAMASFITAYAREITIRSAQANYDRFIYADTDSLHLEGLETPDNLNVHSTELGAWKEEYKFSRGKFLRAKAYVEEIDTLTIADWLSLGLEEIKKDKYYYDEKRGLLVKTHIACAGLPRKCHGKVTFENFRNGASFSGKLQHKRVKGGAVLLETEYKIKL